MNPQLGAMVRTPLGHLAKIVALTSETVGIRYITEQFSNPLEVSYHTTRAAFQRGPYVAC